MHPSRRAERERVLECARTWLATPWHHGQATRGAGVDCAMLITCVFHEAGLIPWHDPRPYPPDWHLHRSAERFLDAVGLYAKPVEHAQPGDVALYKYGRCVSHGAIIEDEEFLIHAWIAAREVTRTERSALEMRLAGYWSVFK